MNVTEARTLLLNPVWAALHTMHTAFAVETGGALRYRADVLPFAAVEDPSCVIDADALLIGGTTYFVGVLPQLTGRFQSAVFPCLQMLYEGPIAPPPPLPNEIEGPAPQGMVDLTTAAFPGFFRLCTNQLGRYIALEEDNQLIAMAGERFRVPGLWEISALCTRPGHTGKGYAAHLMQRLMTQRSDEQCFLHVVATNHRAIELYHRLGFKDINTVDVLKVEQP